MTYPIETSIPLRPALPGKRPLYDFASMDVGDSFWVPAGNIPARTRQKRVSTIACYYAKRTGTKFATRREGDGVRVTRVE